MPGLLACFSSVWHQHSKVNARHKVPPRIMTLIKQGKCFACATITFCPSSWELTSRTHQEWEQGVAGRARTTVGRGPANVHFLWKHTDRNRCLHRWTHFSNVLWFSNVRLSRTNPAVTCFWIDHLFGSPTETMALLPAVLTLLGDHCCGHWYIHSLSACGFNYVKTETIIMSSHGA